MMMAIKALPRTTLNFLFNGIIYSVLLKEQINQDNDVFLYPGTRRAKFEDQKLIMARSFCPIIYRTLLD